MCYDTLYARWMVVSGSITNHRHPLAVNINRYEYCYAIGLSDTIVLTEGVSYNERVL